MYGALQNIPKMEETFATMTRAGIQPDATVFHFMLAAYQKMEAPEKAQQTLETMDKYEIPPSEKTYRILMTIYAQMGNRDELRKTAQICAKLRSGSEEAQALDIYMLMLEAFCFVRNLAGVHLWLRKVEDALKTYPKPSPEMYQLLLKAYKLVGYTRKTWAIREQMKEAGITLPKNTRESFAKE
jgi:hypothetical protein